MTDPIEIGSEKQLFIDEDLIERMENIIFTMNPPIKAGPIIGNADRLLHQVTVLEYDQQVRFYGKNSKRENICAFSNDGVTLEKIVPIKVEGEPEEEFQEATVFVDPTAPPKERFKMIANVGLKFIRIFSSHDGLHWVHHEPPALNFGCDTQNQAFWDDRIGKYAVYFRGWDRHRKRCLQMKWGPPGPARPPESSDWFGERVVKRCEVENMLKPFPYPPGEDPHYIWGRFKRGKALSPAISTEMPTVLSCDEKDPQESDLYNPAVVKYPWAQNAYFAFPSLYYHYPSPPEGLFNDGVLEIQLFTSRDGINWKRHCQPYVRLGLDGENDSCRVYMAVGMIRRGNYIYQYYSGFPYTHGFKTSEGQASKPELLRLVQRLDGFVSADASYDSGKITTKPFIFNGVRLTLNIDTSAMGDARVAIIDPAGKSISRYAAEDCDIINCNSTAKTVTWKGKPDVSDLAGRTVRLRFLLRSTKLYAFQFLPE